MNFVAMQFFTRCMPVARMMCAHLQNSQLKQKFMVTNKVHTIYSLLEHRMMVVAVTVFVPFLRNEIIKIWIIESQNLTVFQKCVCTKFTKMT